MRRKKQPLDSCSAVPVLVFAGTGTVRCGVGRWSRAPVPPEAPRVRRAMGGRVLTARRALSHAPADTLGGTEARDQRLMPHRNAIATVSSDKSATNLFWIPSMRSPRC